MNMNTWVERFYIFARSASDETQRTRLFQFIWQGYSKKIYFYISKIIPLDHLYVDDLFQEIMIKIYHHLHTFNPLYSLKSWIYKITKNHCLNFIKSKEEKIHSSKEPEYDLTNVPEPQNPENHFFNDELMEEIHRFTKTLEPMDKEIFYLRFYENLRYKTISEMMDMKINTVKSRVHLIKLNLKNKLGGGG
ncbi:MAG: sigma-70 family RNA polymerase sigma factor [Candidatus Aminicenantes bacterium]|nr:MAG: sigma-70 family RNA polymerase sigma factor [Candidatus Aminicenantes bacterium]